MHVKSEIHTCVTFIRCCKNTLCNGTIQCQNSLFIMCKEKSIVSNGAMLKIGPSEQEIKEENNTNTYIASFPTLCISSEDIQIQTCQIMDTKAADCILRFDAVRNCEILSSQITSNHQLYLINSSSAIFTNSTLYMNDVFIKNISFMKWKLGTLVSANRIQFDINDFFSMLDKSTLVTAGKECFINCNQFSLHNQATIQCSSGYFQLKCSNQATVEGIININESDIFVIYGHKQLKIKPNCIINANMKSQKKEFVTALQEFDKNTLGLENVSRKIYSIDGDDVNTFQHQSYLRLCCKQKIIMQGKIIGNTSLVVFDAIDEIEITNSSNINAASTIMRCCNDIYLSGIIQYQSYFFMICNKINVKKAQIQTGLLDKMKNNDTTNTGSDIPILRVSSKIIVFDGSRIGCTETEVACVLQLDAEESCEVSNSNFSSHQFNLVNSQSSTFTNSNISSKEIHVKINTMRWNNGTSWSVSNIDKFVLDTFEMNNDSELIVNDVSESTEMKLNDTANDHKITQINVNQFKMSNCSKLTLKCSNNNIMKCTMNVNEFHMEENCIIHCLLSFFQIKATNKVRISGEINTFDAGQLIIYAYNKLIFEKSCNINVHLKNSNKDLLNDLRQEFDDNKLALTDFSRDMYLMTEYKNDDINYLRLCSNSQIDICGKIYGNNSLVIVDAMDSIKIHDTSQFNTHDVFIRCNKDILFDGTGTFSDEQSECNLNAKNKLILEKQSSITTSFAKFSGSQISVAGILNVKTESYFHVENAENAANAGNALVQGKITSKILIFEGDNLSISNCTLECSKTLFILCSNECNILNSSNILINKFENTTNSSETNFYSYNSLIKDKLFSDNETSKCSNMHVSASSLSINDSKLHDKNEEMCIFSFDIKG
eukprot:410892_1